MLPGPFSFASARPVCRRAAGGDAAAGRILAEFRIPGIVWIVSWKFNASAGSSDGVGGWSLDSEFQ